MHRALYLMILLLGSPVSAMAMSFGVTTQMSQGGNLDKDRYFIFDFLVLGKNCAVTAITLNNANCSKDSIGEGRGFWVKVEYESTWEGNNLKCDVRPLGGGRLEVAIVQKITDGEINHRAIVPDKGFGTPVDYAGSMSKFSSMLNRLESVNYVPLRLNSALSGGWENITLGCSRMTVPKIEKHNTKTR
jgi:hypothetical protein